MAHDYFKESGWISNSYLKQIMGCVFPPNIDRIFEFGHLAHACIFEPAKANTVDPDFSLACRMRDTFFKDQLCAGLMKYPNIMTEHEFYRSVDGLRRRCKADTSISDFRLIIEFKGLAISNEKSFLEAIDHFDYDMGAAFYIDTTRYDRELIVAVSKKKPDNLYRFMIEKGDRVYQRGRAKYIEAISKGLLCGMIEPRHITDGELLQNLIDQLDIVA